MSHVHATAIVDSAARIETGVVVGPYSVIGGNVELAAGCIIGSHVVITGDTRIGAGTRIFQFASIGEIAQDKKYAGESARLDIGQNNTIREYVTINAGTAQDESITRIGDHNWIMAYVHIAHDCQIHNHATLANNTTLAGHVHLGDYVTLGGATLVHQFCRIGAHAFTAYGARINKDVPPFVMVSEGRGRPRGLNAEGLRRHGITDSSIAVLKDAYRILYRSNLSLESAIEKLHALETPCEELTELIRFVENNTRSIIR